MIKKILIGFSGAVILGLFVFFGYKVIQKNPKNRQKAVIPHIGSIQVLNGCGKKGVAAEIGDFLRARGFDVKETANAEDWNYPYTIIASRTADMTIAQKVAKALDSDKLIRLEKNDCLFDATVFVGKDYRDILGN